ncbi:probable polyol transporter 6 [Scaptodrosophila lebanonensis]|uniref:Probable polyol transporter 6 n=1 Tax=Drosophila lebanonensis TaxID=7225 RepID=A0A6J2TGA8_DROLE|nr:probable polyol transporter 6 [Scaptodrosophila lebanonensis]
MQATVTSQQQPITIVVTNPRENARAERRYMRWVNQNQTKSTAAVSLLFVYGGMELALGLGWNLYTDIPSTWQFQYSWFIGVLAGAFLSSLLVTCIPKRMFYVLGSLLSLVDAIIFVSAPYEYPAILAARYIGGVGIGIITVPFIIHSSEIAARDYRGICSSVEQYNLSVGIMIQMIYASRWSTDMDFPANQVHGILGIIFSVLALGSIFTAVESPIFYLRQNQEEKARYCQQQLVRDFSSTSASESALTEAKLYVQDGNSKSYSSALMPFLKLLFYRCFVAFTFSVPLSWTIQWSSYIAEGSLISWPASICGVLRMFGSLLAMLFLDKLGRKFIAMLSLLVMAGLMLTIAGIFATPEYALNWYQMDAVVGLCLSFQFFAGLFTPSSTTYLGEAFPMRTKPYFIAFIVAVEQAIHIVVIVSFESTAESIYAYFLAVGIILVIGLIGFAVIMPETRHTTLREAGVRFGNVHNIMSY